MAYSDAEIGAAICSWITLHGRPPSSSDWKPSEFSADDPRWKSWLAGKYPASETVRNRFLSFDEGIFAALTGARFRRADGFEAKSRHVQQREVRAAYAPALATFLGRLSPPAPPAPGHPDGLRKALPHFKSQEEARAFSRTWRDDEDPRTDPYDDDDEVDRRLRVAPGALPDTDYRW
jgi:hypothetical protein